ncbi:Ig-like domain-containing protein [Streptomyces sp. NPDC056492]|uniref:Ig-like domain-containing protein n=2 Tax=unclassified Streptomyces TaxID=2593676 RepID=UPI0036A7583A
MSGAGPSPLPPEWQDHTMPTVLDDGWGLVDPQARTHEVHPVPAAPVGGSEAVTFPCLPAPPAPLSETMRFGPGVSPVPPAPPAPSRRLPSRIGWAVLGAVAAAVLSYLAGHPPWERTLSVARVTLSPSASAVRCGETVRVTATVLTNGAPGTLRYRWRRSDGSSSGLLEERLSTGQRSAALETTWSISGPGGFSPEVTLEVSDPQPQAASVSFAYACTA